jgi:phenylacetic acid degradation operon negative regulatory protein
VERVNQRSLIFDLFGGYVRYDGGVIGLQGLAALGRCFGISSDAVRVVMSRLRREGWFEVERVAGRARYRATERTWRLLDEGYQRIFEQPEPWSGNWYVVIYEVPEPERAVREQLRKTLSWLGFGPLAASTWVSPHDRLDAVLDWVRDQPSARVDTLVARSRSDEQDLDFASRCWDLDGLKRDYQQFLDQYGSADGRRAWRDATGTDALVAQVRLAHDYRLFLFRDPGLPAHLLPADWPAPKAAELFAEAYEHLSAEAMAAYRSLTGSPDRTSPETVETLS